MKRLSLLGFIGVMAAFLAGCPIYDDNDGDGHCESGDCTGPDVPRCTSSADCGVNETCGSDNECHSGDCTVWGCPEGSTCEVGEDLTASCQPGTTGSGGSGAGGSGSGGSGAGGAGGAGGGPVVIWCGNPGDCEAGETCGPDGTCQPGTCDVVGCIWGYSCDSGQCKPTDASACGEDSDCSGLGAGWLCISGQCTAPADQCSDQSQCEVSGSKCVDGVCIPACTSDVQCGNGYACDEVLGICTVPVKPCAITNDCGGPDAVCVDGVCVPRSQMGTCGKDEVWVENGCIPNQSADFNCTQDGAQDVCASGSICLHHNCYISCEAPNGNACVNQAPSLNTCKSVTTSSGPHQVCGSNDTLGNECDPTAGVACAAGKICIDGFCK